MNENPFPLGTMAWSQWESERKKTLLAQRRTLVLEGTEPPADFLEEAYVRSMGGPYGPRSSWQKRWTLCAKCGVEWLASGHPVGRYAGLFPQKLVWGSWVYPGICEPCYDAAHAIKMPVAKSVAKKVSKN